MDYILKPEILNKYGGPLTSWCRSKGKDPTGSLVLLICKNTNINL